MDAIAIDQSPLNASHARSASNASHGLKVSMVESTLIPPYQEAALDSFKYEKAERVLITSDARTTSYYLSNPFNRGAIRDGDLQLDKNGVGTSSIGNASMIP